MRKTVLIVDDSRSMRQQISFVLEHENYLCIEAENGQEGYSKLKANEGVTLIITDLHMPVMDGLGMIQEIRKDPAYKGLPIIVLTTEVAAKSIQRAQDIGAQAYMIKPFKPSTLIDCVRKVAY